jgi:hypothetical protein
MTLRRAACNRFDNPFSRLFSDRHNTAITRISRLAHVRIFRNVTPQYFRRSTSCENAEDLGNWTAGAVANKGKKNGMLDSIKENEIEGNANRQIKTQSHDSRTIRS